MVEQAASPAHTFPAAHALQVIDLAKRWDVPPGALLSAVGLDEEELTRPGARLSVEDLVALLERARELTGEPGLGVYLGLHKRISAYGFLGFAAMSAGTMRQALELAVRFSHTVSTALTLRLVVDGDSAALHVDEHADLGSARDIANLSFFVGLGRITFDLTEREARSVAELAIPEPPYFARFAHLLPGARFGCPEARVVFGARGLDVPLSRPDPAALNLAREQCQAALEALGFESSLPAQVRRAVFSEAGVRTIDQVAATLGTSARTLKRRLAEHGVSFSELSDEERRARTLELLRTTQLPIDEIAGRLGYSTTSNFARAFRRWTGQSPAAFRRGGPA